MDIVKSSLWREVEDILASGSKPVHYTWQVVIHANGEEIKPLRVLSIDVNQDFLNNYADFILVTLVLPLGTYAKRVRPYLDDLDIELIRTPIGEVAATVNQDTPSQSERYTATMIDNGDPIAGQSVGIATSEEELNRIDIPTLRFQLVDKALEQLRMISIGSTFRNMTGEEVVRSQLTAGSQRANVNDARRVMGVQMVKASNQEKRQQIIVPPNTELVNLPHHIHYYGGGLYAGGLGYYLHKDHWYVYPAYDHTRFKSGVPTLTIINLPENKLPGIERTFRNDDGNLVIIATGPSSFENLKNLAQLNLGNGIRFADGSKMMEEFAVVKDNKAIASRGKNNTEMISDQRKNGMNNVKSAMRDINANPYVEYSSLAARQGNAASFVWENADRSLLYPGMPTKVMYLDGNDIQELYGVLLGAHEFTSLKEQGPTATRFSSSVTLSVFSRMLDDSET